MLNPNAHLSNLPRNRVARRLIKIAGAVSSAQRTLYAAHEASTMTSPGSAANLKRLRELGLLP